MSNNEFKGINLWEKAKQIESSLPQKRKEIYEKIDSIPQGGYPKLTNCDIYPLRNSCNHGETEDSKWERCE